MRIFEQELKEALDRQAATSEILRVISSSPKSAQPVFEAIVQAGQRLFPEAIVSIALEVGNEVHVAAIAGPNPAGVAAWRKRFPVQRDKQDENPASIKMRTRGWRIVGRA